jgi:hypothetical protein
MAQIINASIDLSKIDKTKIVEGKNGAKYYNFSITVNDEKDQFGNDVKLTAQQSKEEREVKTPKVYIGNGKTSWKSGETITMGALKQQMSETMGNAIAASIPQPVNDLPF